MCLPLKKINMEMTNLKAEDMLFSSQEIGLRGFAAWKKQNLQMIRLLFKTMQIMWTRDEVSEAAEGLGREFCSMKKT